MATDNETSTIRDLIDRMAGTQPEVPFLLSPETGKLVTFRGLQEQSRILSNELLGGGLKPGDKIAFLLDNGLFTAQLFLGVMYGGFVAVPLNVGAGVSQLSYTLDHSDAGVVYVGEKYGALIEEVLANVRRPVCVISADVDGLPMAGETAIPRADLKALGPEDPALLMYTSGSTGQPKAAVHSHRTVLAHGRNSISSYQLSPADRSLLVLPLYHINAECVTLVPTLMSGGSVVVPHRFSVSQFWDWLDEYRCTWSALVPTIVSQLLDWRDPRADSRGSAFERIRFLRSSSAPLAPSLHREFLEKFPLLLVQAMGSSEAGNVFSNPLPPGENKIGSPGLPWGFEAKIVDREGVELPPGESGEVVIRGAAVMQGYYKQPEETEAVLDPDGWLHTGDLAYRDQDGYFFVVGRSKELIIKGGVNIAPRQIDDVLESHPAVLEAAAVGVPDHYLGEDLVAFVVLRSGITSDEKELLSFCEGRLGHFKTPTRIYFANDLPKGPSGKVQRLRLRDDALSAISWPASSVEVLQKAHGNGSVPHNGLPPETSSIEQVIAESWAEVLSQPHVDVESNFFALGGHSLLAVQCVSLLRDRIPVALSLSDFFEHATVGQQAALVRRRLAPDVPTKGQAPAGQPARNVDQAFQNISSSVTPSAIPPRDRALPCPLSPAQRRLWFMEQLNPGLPVYNESEAVRLLGELNVDEMERALNVIIARHEILRTTIQMTDNEPVAVVHESWPLQIKKIDLTGLPASERQAEVERLLIDEPRRLYHLETEPGIRATLLRLGAREHVFILMMHHIICDWSSEGVLWRELAALYRSFSRGEQPVLPHLTIQHGDYAAWLVQQNSEANFAEDLAFWEENLHGAPQLLELPGDRPRPLTVSYRGARQRFILNPTLTKALREIGKRTQTTLFTVFAAALNTLLYRYTQQEDILLGIPIADRDRKEMQSLMGFLLHTQVLRTKLSADMTFTELLARVQKTALDLYLHRAVPFDHVVRKIQPERNLSYSPLFQVMLNWRDRDQLLSFIGLERLDVESLLAESGTSKFDLTLFATDCGDEIWLEMEYSTDLFDRVRIARMLEHYQVLLESVAADPGKRLSDMPILRDAERQQLLVEWNDTRTEFPADASLHELFETQAKKTPEAVAVEFDGSQLSYRELNERSNQLANYLRGMGVGTDTLVGVSMERSLELVVALYAVLKAGGAYVPIDPEYPRERIAFILQDADVPVLLTQARLTSVLPSHNSRVVCVDREWERITRETVANPVGKTDPNHLAYMIYTSGSTGTPKGAMNTHGAICNRLLWMQEQYGLRDADRVLQKTPFSFDVSVWEFFWPLLAGARLVVAEPGGHRDAAYLVKLIRAQGITVLHFVPSMLRAFLDEANVDTCLSLRHVICSGEALPYDLQEQFFELLPSQLHNLYGPTEAAVDVTHWICRRADDRKIVPIGRPVANTQIYILDRCLRPVPIGVPGELHIGGVQVGRGYHKRPELTAEKFIPDPFSGDQEARLYKTGDLCRWLPDGVVEYLDRMDFQVKIRGFRIELGEIEDVIRQHPGVKEALVSVREDTPGDKRIVSYLVPAEEPACTASELQGYLKQKLPEYMVPAAFVLLPELPLNPNGKVDRKALPAPEGDAYAARGGYEAPQGAVETTIAGIWADLLKVERVSRHDNFFELGGHSLLATRLVSRFREVFGVEVPLRSLFESPTVAGFAEYLEGGFKEGFQTYRPQLPSIARVSRGGELPLSFAQMRLWLLNRLEPSSATYNIPSCFRLKGQFDRAVFERGLTEIVRRHEVLRTCFVMVDGQPVQKIAPPEAFRVPPVDLQGLPAAAREEEAARLALADARQLFDFSRSPLMRATVLQLAPDEHLLLLNVHHIAFDGWSFGVFAHELSALYNAFRNGRASPLPELPIQYADFAVWQRQLLQGEVLQTQLDYWKERLSGSLPVLELPADRPRPALQTYEGSTVSFALSRELTEGLKALSRREGCTLFVTLLATFQVLLLRYTGQEDILVGLPIANRNRAETEGLIGFFVNTLVMRSDLSGNPRFRELLGLVQETALGAWAHQDLPFERLVEELQPERDQSRSPIFQAMLSLQNAPMQPLDLSGLDVSRMRVDSSTSKFDLTLSGTERPEGLSCTFEYNTCLFNRDRVERMAGHLQVLLEGIVADPQQRLSELRLLTETERQQLLVEWSDTQVDYPADVCLHDLFETQAKKTPEGVALTCEGVSLTYRELSQRANQLAHALLQSGVGPDVIVGVYMERSLQLVIGVLGILKAGGAYLPIDLTYPKERVIFMLEDASAQVLLTQSKLAADLPLRRARVVCLDDADLSDFQSQPTSNPLSDTSSDNLAYVIYTSGTTDQPKGSLITHRNVTRLFSATEQWYGFNERDVWTLFHSCAFDFSVWEIWGALLYGGRLVVVPFIMSRSPEEFYKLLAEAEVTVLSQTPSAFRQLIHAEESVGQKQLALRYVVFGGEALETQSLRPWFERHGDHKPQLVNMYGITETTVHVTYRPLSKEDLNSGSVIGVPIPDLQIYILDAQRQPVPIGVPGEMYVSGAGLARGYLHRPELTAERFIPNHLTGRTGSRLYKTGDLARFMPGHDIQYLGRLDHQVKIRGFRIELGEIETLLSSHPGVREAVVAAREDAPGDKRLVAYVVPAGEPTCAAAELRDYLKQKLPEYMVPVAFVLLPELPLTTNGKVNRKLLPAPDGDAYATRGYEAPQGEVETTIAGIWADLLKVERVSRHDNYFELGGHSLLATRLAARIRCLLGINAPLRGVFENPTVSQFAEYIEALRWNSPEQHSQLVLAAVADEGEV